MDSRFDLQDFSIVLSAKNLNPSLLTPDFLKASGVVPTDWELAQPPVFGANSAQVVFKNGSTIVGQPGRVTFSESLSTEKAIEDVEIAKIASKYVSALPNIEYQAVGINPRRFVTFAGQADGAHKYITETILSRGSWQNIGTAPVQAGINLVYTLERCQFRLAINEARLQLPDQQAIPAVLFAGNFHYSLAGLTGDERLRNLHQQLDSWTFDLETYQEIIEKNFLVAVKPAKVFTIRDAS